MQWTGTPSGAETIMTWAYDSLGPTINLRLQPLELWMDTNPPQQVPILGWVVRYNMTEWGVLTDKAFQSLRPFHVHASQMRRTA